MESSLTYEQALAALAWQIELGAEDAILDAPVDRYALGEADRAARAAAAEAAPAAQSPRGTRPPVPPPPPNRDLIGEAATAASAAADLDALAQAFAALDTPLAKGARHFLMGTGTAGAPLMVVGEAPSREDDMAGTAYAGLQGALMDRMLAAIGRAREGEAPTYLTYALPWRLPPTGDVAPQELALIRPFLLRHIALAKPQVILLQGNLACQALLGGGSVTRLRATWAEVAGIPALPSHALDRLMGNPALKREAWADLLALKARLG